MTHAHPPNLTAGHCGLLSPDSLPLGPPCCYSLVPTRVLVFLFQKSSCLPLRAEPGLAWLPVFRSLPCSPFWESLLRKEACENQPPFLGLSHSVHPAGRRMGLELYLDLLSQPCRAVYIFAKKNHIPFELRNVELFKDSILGTKVPGAEMEGGAIPPSGSLRKEGTRVKKVPVLKDETFILAEGTAILLYLSRKYNTPDHWYPSDLQKRAKVDEYLSWHQANIRSNAPKTMWIKVLIPLFTGQPLPAEKLQEVMDGLATALDQFEGLFLQDKPFLVGSEVSLADLVAIVDLMQPVGVGCDIFKDRPRLAEWRKRTEDVIGKELFLQAHELILNVSKLSTIQIDPQLKEQLAPVLLKMMR